MRRSLPFGKLSNRIERMFSDDSKGAVQKVKTHRELLYKVASGQFERPP
jgi:hypothetical protein